MVWKRFNRKNFGISKVLKIWFCVYIRNFKFEES